MFSFAIRRVREPHSWRGASAGSPFVANIDPEAACLGFSVAGSKHLNRRIPRQKRKLHDPTLLCDRPTYPRSRKSYEPIVMTGPQSCSEGNTRRLLLFKGRLGQLWRP